MTDVRTFRFSRSSSFSSTSTMFTVVLLLIVLDVGQAQLTFSLPGKWGSGRKRSELTPINVGSLIANRRLGLGDNPSTRNWVMSDSNVEDSGSLDDDDDLERSRAESSMTMNDNEAWLKRTPSSEGYFDEEDYRKVRDHHHHVKRLTTGTLPSSCEADA